METSGVEDDFFGDQSSDSDNDSTRHAVPTTFGNISKYEFESQKSSVKTLSFLDGYDETKERRLQEGFSIGYRQSFGDAFRIGKLLGGIYSRVALHESLTINLEGKDGFEKKLRRSGPANGDSHAAAFMVKKFLTNDILSENSCECDAQYQFALSKLEDDLQEQAQESKNCIDLDDQVNMN